MRMTLIIGLMGLLSMLGCSTVSYKAGDIYSVDDGNGKIGIVKVLVVEPKIIHLRVYKNKFNSRPKSINTTELSLGRIADKGGFGVGHMPLDIDGFKDWKPELLINEKVEDNELDGYNIWKQN
jgi:hypothetical protein